MSGTPLFNKTHVNNKSPPPIFSSFIRESQKLIFRQKNSENRNSGKSRKSHMPADFSTEKGSKN